MKSLRGIPRIELDIPDGSWLEIWADSLDSAARKAGFGILRETFIGNDALEIRVWSSFGFGFQGVIIQKDNKGNWRGFHLGNGSDEPREVFKDQIKWEILWNRLRSHNVESLPDSSVFESPEALLDGGSYVVELMKGTRYRAYRYDPIALGDRPEGKQMGAIADLLRDECLIGGYF